MSASILYSCASVSANAPSYWFPEVLIEGQTQEERDLRKWVGSCMSRIGSQLHKSIMRHRDRTHGSTSFRYAYCDNPFSKTVSCRLRILKDGCISDLEIVSSSGSLRADLLAYSVIRRAAPFEPPPNRLALDRGLIISFVESAFDKPPPLQIGLFREQLGPTSRRASPLKVGVPPGSLDTMDFVTLAHKYAVLHERETAQRFLEKARACMAKDNISPAREAQLDMMMAEIYDICGDGVAAITLYRKAATAYPELTSNEEFKGLLAEVAARHTHCGVMARTDAQR